MIDNVFKLAPFGRYRICPQGETEWKVQKFGTVSWIDCVERHGKNHKLITFATEVSAERYIDEELLRNRVKVKAKETIEKREREVEPREYP